MRDVVHRERRLNARAALSISVFPVKKCMMALMSDLMTLANADEG